MLFEEALLYASEDSFQMTFLGVADAFEPSGSKGTGKARGNLRKGRLPIENPGNLSNNPDLGSEGVCGATFTLNFKKRIAESSIELFCFILN